MEAAVSIPTDEAPVPASDLTPEPAEQRTPAEMFRWSAWVHLGPGAEECEAINEEAGTNECGNPLHFHGWCRLPNQFQHREMREKALAEKARRMRQLRDPESDAYAVLEEELDSIARRGDEGKSELIDELVGRKTWQTYTEAVGDVRDIDDENQVEDAIEPTKKYEHIEDDERRLALLRLKPDEERPTDEYESLERHVKSYYEAVQARLDEIQKPYRDALAERDLNELVDEARTLRIEGESTQAFMHVYNSWSWYLGTLRRPPRPGEGHERAFASIEAMQEAAPEVVTALETTFNDLERSRNDPAGN